MDVAEVAGKLAIWQQAKFLDPGLSHDEARELLPWCGGCDFRATGRWQWCGSSYDPEGKHCLGFQLRAHLKEQAG